MCEKEGGPMPRRNSDGFSTIEVLVAIFVIVIALTSLLSLFSYAIATMQLTQDLLIAKQKAREALESIFTARNTSQITFDMIQNDSVIDGIFLVGYQDLRRPSTDGLIGTFDDGDEDIETLFRYARGEVLLDVPRHTTLGTHASDEPLEVREDESPAE